MQGKHTLWTSLFGFLPAALLAAFVTISLHDYTAPIFSVEQEDMASSKQETTASGKKSSSKTAAVTTKTAPTVEPLAEQTGGYKDGTYTGSGTGFSGLITVQVVIEGGKITDITIVSTTDDSPYIDNASALLKTIIELKAPM